MELLNLLYNGLHQDNDPAAQPPHTYRDALNGNLISYGNGRYGFESIKGTLLSFTIPFPRVVGKRPFAPVGFASFPDKLILFSADEETINTGEIGEVTFDNAGIGTYLPLYCHKDLGFSKNNPFPKDGIVTKPENISTKRVYFTDNKNPLRVFNTVDPRIRNVNGTLKTVASGSLTLTKQYMVLSNIPGGNNVEHPVASGNFYGAQETLGTVFTATTTTYGGTGFVVEYIPIDSLSVVPNHNLGKIRPKQISGGNLLSGSYQYAYQLESATGARSNWSYVSLPVYIANTAYPGTNTLSYVNYQGESTVVDVLKRMIITIDGIDTSFSKIRVAFIHGTAFKVLNDPEIFFKGNITGSLMDIDHFGTEITEKLLNIDLTTITPSLDLVKSIAAAKNILFPANVGLTHDPEIDLTASVTAEVIEYLIPSDTAGEVTNANLISAGFGVIGHTKVNSLALGNTAILPRQWYEVTGTAGGGPNTVVYNAVTYNAGQFFRGLYGVLTATQNGDCRAIAVIRIQKYTSPATLTAGNYENIRIVDDFVDYKGTVVAHYLKSHWRKEKYRYGFLVWNLHGVPLFVNFLKDKTFPAQYNDGVSLDTAGVPWPATDGDGGAIAFDPSLIEYDDPTKTATVRSLGIRFSNFNFNIVATAFGVSLADLPKVIKGFSIVRCPRDETIVAQGIMFPTLIGGANQIHPQSIIDIGNDSFYPNGRKPNYYNWFSPDFLQKFDGRPNISAGDYLRIEDYYEPSNVADPVGGPNGLRIVSGHNWYWKHYTPAVASAANGFYSKGAIQLLFTPSTIAIDTAAIGVAIPSQPFTFNNFARVGNVAALTSKNRFGAGSRTMLIAIDTDETGFPNGFGDFGQFAKKKPVVSWIRNKSNLYGGTSPEAKAANLYMWCNHYQPLDSAFMTYMTGTADATPSNPGQLKAAGIVNNVEVFGGDAFVNITGITRHLQGMLVPQVAYGLTVPLESNINTGFVSGRNFVRDRFFNSAEAPNGLIYNTTPSLSKDEAFLYSSMYSNSQHQLLYPARPIGFAAQKRDEHLILFSDTKTDGEIIDSWTQFRPNNFNRVDGQFGAIINVRAKSTRLFYWQNKGIGYLPVQERTTIGSPLGDAVQLGIGGVIERFDEIDYFYGNQHQHGISEAEDFFMWFDMRRRAMLRLGFGGQLDKMKMIEGLDSFFNSKLDEIETETPPTILDSDNPFIGRGITSIYDSHHKIAFITFRYNKVLSGPPVQTVQRDFTIGYSRKLDKYMAFFSHAPITYVEHNRHLISSTNVRPTITALASYTLGEEIVDTNDYHNYVCILAFTAGVFPVQPSLDPTRWSKSSQINEIYLHWKGDICKFYGVVRESYISPVIRTQDGTKITNDNVEELGNSVQWTDIFTSNSYQSGQDTNIRSTDKNYRYYDGSWWYNLPLTSRGERLSDSWVLIKLRMRNFVGNAVTASTNQLKRIFSIKSSIRKKQ